MNKAEVATGKYTITDESTVHSNTHYRVIVNDEGTGYRVINIATGVTEAESINLPECIFAAENLDAVLTFKTYEWVARRAEKQQEADRQTTPPGPHLSLIN